MTSNNIEKYIPLKKDNLDPYHYTLSLLKEAERLGLIRQKAIDNIHKEFMVLLGELLIKYTGGESTSVKIETGERIMLSILYCMDACTRSFPHPRDAINLLTSSSIKETYQVGLQLVESCRLESEILFQEIKNNKLDIPSEAYQYTIDKDLPEFFRNYDALFAAQDIVTAFDYPLLFDDMQVQGVYYIRQYLARLKMETSFCCLFNQQHIKRLLYHYGRVYGIDYKVALINIFEIVLTNSIFSVLSGNKAREILITEIQLAYIQEKFKELTHIQCSSNISEAVEILITELSIADSELRDYIRKLKSILMPRFLCAREHDTLGNVVILDVEDNNQADIFFDEGNKLDNDSFCSLIEGILEQTEAREKVELINRNIRSLGDFIDVLEADCLYGDEFRNLFDTLGDLELSVLARIVFMEELRADPISFAILNAQETSASMKWQIEFQEFVQHLSPERLKAIEKLLCSPVRVTEL